MLVCKYIFRISLLFFGLSAQAHAQWVRAETDHFICYSDGSEASLRADAIRLERFDAAARVVVGLPASKPGVKLRVYFVGSLDAVKRLYQGPGSRISGFYFTKPSGAYAVVSRNAGDKQQGISDDYVMFHEYTHHLMYQYFPVSYPNWYVEGFAEFLGNTKINDDGSAKLGLANQSRGQTLLNEVGLPIETILSSSTSHLRSNQIQNFYGLSWSLVHLLTLDSARKGQLSEYLAAVTNGIPSVQAARTSFGDLTVLRKDMRTLVESRNLTSLSLSKPPNENIAITVTRLSKGDSAAVIPQFSLSQGLSTTDASKLRAALRALALTYPDSGAIHTALAEAELDLKQFDAAGAEADLALKIDPMNSRALLWKGLAQSHALLAAKSHDGAAWKAARAFIVKANRANPNDPLPLFENFQSYRDEGITPTESAVKGLEGAQILVPQNAILRIFFAVAIADRKRFDDASAILLPVSNDPHGGGLSVFAGKLLAAIQRAKVSGSLAEVDEMERLFSRRGS